MSVDNNQLMSCSMTRLDHWVIRIGDIVSLLYLVAVLISAYEIFMRYFLNAPTVWVHETTIAIVGMSMAYGGLYCNACEGHISVTVVKDMLPEKAKRILEIINSALVFLFSLGGGYAMYYLASKAVFRPSGEMYLQTSGSAWNSPLPAITKLFIFAVFLLLAVQSLLHLIIKIRNGIRGE